MSYNGNSAMITVLIDVNCGSEDALMKFLPRLLIGLCKKMNQNALQDDSSNWLPADAPSEDFSSAFFYDQLLVPVSLFAFLRSF